MDPVDMDCMFRLEAKFQEVLDNIYIQELNE
jgi:hypothetical protein